MDNKKQTVFHGALILLCANLMVKVIGAAFKIPLTYLIGEDGMGLFGQAYTVYSFLFVVATAGFPVAISKMVAESTARGNAAESRKIFRIALVVLFIIGGICTIGLFFGAGAYVDHAIKDPGAYMAVLAISPAIFFVAIMSAFRGYFNGQQNMYPTAFSEVIESLGKLIVGYILAAYLLKLSLEHAAAGAILGVTSGAFLGAALLVIIYFFRTRDRLVKDKPTRTAGQITRELFRFVIPVTIGASAAQLTNLLDSLTIVRRLQDTPGITVEVARSLFGRYTGYAVPMFNMPLTLVVALAMSVVPAVSGALALGKKLAARKIVEGVLRITMLFALPCGVGLSVLAEPILLLLFRTGDAASLLQRLGPAVVFVAFLSISLAILQAYSKPTIPVINMLIGGVLKVILNYNLIPIFGIDAAPISTGICYFVIIALNLFFVMRYTEARLNLLDFLLKPILSAGAMGLVVVYVNKLLQPRLGNTKTCIVAIAAGGLIYFVALFVFRAIHREDVEMLPKGDKIAELLKKYRLIS